MTAVRTDPGLVTEVSGLGPARYTFLPAGFTNGEVATGHVIFQGFSAENSGSADNSLTAENSVTGPAAGATITSLVLPAGTWVINWTVGLGSGAVAAADTNNMELTGLAAPLVAIIPAVANTQVPQPQVTLTTTGVTIAVKAIALATATAIYEAQLVATPVAAGFLRCYDGRSLPTSQISTCFLAELQSETEYLGDSGIECQRGLYVAATASSIAVTVWYLVIQDE